MQAIKDALSAARMGTYEAAIGITGDGNPAALTLYAWNAQVSGALLAPLHICEVVMRNAVSDALTHMYGKDWPWSPGFVQSLPLPNTGYSQRKDLQNACRNASTTGKVIPELKFVFWQKMFTSRHEQRLWKAYLTRVLPNVDMTKSLRQQRQGIYDDLEQIRMLRNRIAHHEPIFTRNLANDFQKIVSLVEIKCKVTANWMINNQQALAIINAKP
jgi:hypothetical protein